MRGQRWFAIGVLITVYGMTLGCQTAGPRKPIVTTEPGLAGPVDKDGTTVAADGTRQIAAGQNSHVGRPAPTFLKAA